MDKHLSMQAVWPRRYILSSILCSMGGILFGMDTAIIGPITVMPSFTTTFGTTSGTMHGFIVSLILIPAALTSVLGNGVADKLGRSEAISVGALLFGIGAALEAGAVNLAMFIVGRVVEGAGGGLYLGTLVVYICEISPPSMRGPLTSGPQLLNTLGLVLGFFTCYGTRALPRSLSWRLPFALLAAFSLFFAAASAVWLPPSPRWLVLRDREAEAPGIWDRLGVEAKDRDEAQNVSQDENTPLLADAGRPKTLKQDSATFWDLFTPDVRHRTILSVFLMAMQQFSGIDGVLYYAPMLFEQAGLTDSSSSFLASGITAIIIFLVTIPGFIWADKWGRRSSTILGGLGLSLPMLLIGTLYASSSVHTDHGAGRWIVIASIYIFTVVFCVSWAVGIKIYAAESQPQRTRAGATSLAHGSNWAANFIVALTTPILLAWSSSAMYFIFGSLSLFTAGVCWFWMPETRGKTLEEIEIAFRVHGTKGKGFVGLLRRIRGFVRRS